MIKYLPSNMFMRIVILVVLTIICSLHGAAQIKNTLPQFGNAGEREDYSAKQLFRRYLFILTTALFGNVSVVAQNIPLSEIINKVYKEINLSEKTLYYNLGPDVFIIDTNQQKGSDYKLRLYRSNKEMQQILKTSKIVTELGFTFLKIVSDTIVLRLTLGEVDEKTFYQNDFYFGVENDSRDIECIYDKNRQRWVYLRTIEVRDF